MTVSRHRHDVRPPNAASDFHEAKARSASRWFRLASSASEATKHRTDVGKDSASKAFPLMDLRAMFMSVAPVRRREPMVAVTFLSSVQGYQEGRVEEIVKRLRADHPEWKADILSPEASKPVLATYKLQFGPAILVNERIEFVGVPRYRMLVERIAIVAAGKISPRTAQPPTPATPAAGGVAKPAAPARPATTPEQKPPP